MSRLLRQAAAAWATAALLLPVCSQADVPETQAPEARILLPGVVVEESLGAGQSHLYRFSAGPLGRWRILLEQRGVDAALEISWAGLAEPWIVDSPQDRDGPELALLPPEVSGDVGLVVRGLAAAGTAGPYILRIDALPEPSGRRGLALAVTTEAGRAYGRGDGEGRQRAQRLYQQAFTLWRDLGEELEAARCLYAAAVLHRLLGDELEALDLARRVLPRWQELGDRGREADTWNEIGLLEAGAGRLSEAREAYRRALAMQQGAGLTFRQGATLNNLCLSHLQEGKTREALDCYGPALDRIRALGDVENEAVALTNLGWIYRTLGRPEEALHSYEQALAVLGALGDEHPGRRARQGQLLNNRAVLLRELGEVEEAVGDYLEALEIFRATGDRRWQGHLLHNLGSAYGALGDPDRGRAFYEEALILRRELGDTAGEALTLAGLGHGEVVQGRLEQALGLYRRTLELERAMGDRQGEAQALVFAARALQLQGDPAAALEALEEARDRAGEGQDRRLQGDVARGTAEAYLHLGRIGEAERLLEGLLEISPETVGPDRRARALTLLAETLAAGGRRREARERVDEALEIFESLRGRLAQPDLPGLAAAHRREAYELRLQLLVEGTPGQRDLEEALETSERARAWGLLELLRSVSIESLVEQAEPELAVRYRSARRRFQALARDFGRQEATSASEGAGRDLPPDLLLALAELEQAEMELRRTAPELASLTLPGAAGGALNAAAMGRLLDPGTALLEYFVGRRQSYLFRLTAGGVRAWVLPPAGELQVAVAEVYGELSGPDGSWPPTARGAEAEEELSRRIFAGALKDFEGDRLAIVADGPLHYLPFAALPLPSTPPGDRGGARLLSRYEIVHLPSVSALALGRQRARSRDPAEKWAAVLADPVFDRRDLRLPPIPAGPSEGASKSRARQENQEGNSGGGTAGGRDGTTPSTVRGAFPDLPRLRTSRREAEAVASLAPDGEVLLALSFDASRDLVASGELARYRIVHLATHGLIDEREPALSSLVLSRFDAAGRPREGALGLRDVYGLQLSADLVVLSACRTALGKEIQGEGFVGFTRGFLHAGASRVLASLWSVPDAATAELMERFYRALATEGLSPAAALRQAQQSMAADSRFRRPRDWAGFVLVGDWRAP